LTVKEKRGRRRYIAFTVGPEITKDIAISSLRMLCGDPPYVVQCAEGWAILRCSPENIEETKALMRRVDASSAPLKTSGTLATLRDAYPELKRLRPAKKMLRHI